MVVLKSTGEIKGGCRVEGISRAGPLQINVLIMVMLRYVNKIR